MEFDGVVVLTLRFGFMLFPTPLDLMPHHMSGALNVGGKKRRSEYTNNLYNVNRRKNEY